MIRAILDTNVVVQSLISSPPAASARVLDAYYDSKFLDLAEASDADYLVTNDRRHLLGLKRHHRTEIITPAEFLRRLA